jgi:hypothetical protein
MGYMKVPLSEEDGRRQQAPLKRLAALLQVQTHMSEKADQKE